MTATINANLFRLAAMFASDEDGRHYLNGVYVEPHAVRGVTLTATDGHRLVCIHDVEGVASRAAIIRLDKASLRQCRPLARETGRILRIAFGDKPSATEGEIVAVGGNMSMRVAGIEIDGVFPDWRRVIGSREIESPAFSGFNARYVADFALFATELTRAINGSSRASGVISITSSSPGDPALVRIDGVDCAFGILMPMRLSGSPNVIPAFIDALPSAAA